MPILQTWTPFPSVYCCSSLLRGGQETFLGCGGGCGLLHAWPSLPVGKQSCRGTLFTSSICVAPDEMSESRQTHVTLHDIDPQALEQLVQYAYTAEIVVGEGNVQVGASPQTSLLHKAVLYETCLPGTLLSSCSTLSGVVLWWHLHLAVVREFVCSPAPSLATAGAGNGSSKHYAMARASPEHLPFSCHFLALRGVTGVLLGCSLA